MPDSSANAHSQPQPKSFAQSRGGLAGALSRLGIRNRATLVLILLLLALTGFSAWTYLNVRQSLRDIREAGLQALLATQVEALSRWIEEKKSDAAAWARRPEVRAPVADLARIARGKADPAPALNQAPARTAFLEALAPELHGEHVAGVNAVDATGRIIATPFEPLTGRFLTQEMISRIAGVFRGETQFIAPYPESGRVAGSDFVAYRRPVAWVEAPVRDGEGRTIAALGFAKYADERFAQILTVARPGLTGEAYAFDASGAMISESRFTKPLQDAGLLPGGDASAILRAQLRDPGGNLLEGYRPEGDAAARPLTRLATAAIGSIGSTDATRLRGVIVEPYRNYLGVDSVGAWRWLPEYGMGVAVEMSVEEGYAPLAYFHASFGAMLGLLLLLWLGAYLSPEAWSRLKGEADPAQVGPYRLLQQVGEGGMSTVYLARHAYLRRPTAVKVLKPHAATDEMIARFAREVQLASLLRHPNTVRIYDYGRAFNGLFYYAMEYLDGFTLGEMVERFGPLPAGRAAHVLKQVCASLAEMHGKGLIHRDIKPQNIMLCRPGGGEEGVKVLDFGLVKDVRSAATRDLTRAVKILGTPLYMAPERIRNPGDADARADIYALGAVAFFILSGRKLFESANDLDLTNQVLNTPPPRLSGVMGSAVPRELDQLVDICLAKDRAKRPGDVAELAAVCDAVLAREPWTGSQAAAWWREHAPAVETGLANEVHHGI
ncbi:MAG TPA: serine/threonine protein kinase [Burkholderiales bacterium]|nr:serine/threonine protein kinase [Burkholderiales bacterium]